MAPVWQEIRLLKNYPGWSELREIISAKPSIIYFEGQKNADQKINLTIEKWSQKWNAPGKELFAKALMLVESCKKLENRKAELKKEWKKIYSDRLIVNYFIYSEKLKQRNVPLNILRENKESEDRIWENLNIKNKKLLNLLEIDSIGLYNVEEEKIREWLSK